LLAVVGGREIVSSSLDEVVNIHERSLDNDTQPGLPLYIE